jgi:hypothetical protein
MARSAGTAAVCGARNGYSITNGDMRVVERRVVISNRDRRSDKASCLQNLLRESEPNDIRHVVESRSITCASLVYPCFDPDGGDNSSLTAGMHPLPSTRICFDPLGHRYLR